MPYHSEEKRNHETSDESRFEEKWIFVDRITRFPSRKLQNVTRQGVEWLPSDKSS